MEDFGAASLGHNFGYKIAFHKQILMEHPHFPTTERCMFFDVERDSADLVSCLVYRYRDCLLN